MTVVLTKIAEADLEGIGDHIARDNPARAVTFIAELRQACAELDLFPEAHALAEGLEARLVRRHSRGGYRIYYRVNGPQIEVLRILHHAREVGHAFDLM